MEVALNHGAEEIVHTKNNCVRKGHITAYEIDKRNIDDILDQIWKDADLYPYAKQFKSKQYGRKAFYAIYTRWLGPDYVNVTASEAEAALKTLTYDGEKKALN